MLLNVILVQDDNMNVERKNIGSQVYLFGKLSRFWHLIGLARRKVRFNINSEVQYKLFRTYCTKNK